MGYTVMLGLIAMLFAACSLKVPAADGPSTSTPTLDARAQEQVFVIQNTTQAFVTSNFSIGAGNFQEEEYTDASGAPTRGPTAGLWLSQRDSQEGPKAVRVHHGEEIEFGGYVVRVLAIRRAGRDSAITVGISEPAGSRN